MKQIVIIAEDRVGLLADVSYLLGKAKINIESISVEVVGNKAVIRMVVKDEKRATEVLTKNGYKVVTSDALVIKLKDEPGELSKVAKSLASNQINIENINLLTKSKEYALIALRVDKMKKAEKLLKDYLTVQ